MNRQSAALGPAHLLHRLPARHMHDHDGNADDLGVADGAVGGLALDRLGPGNAVIVGRDMALAFETAGEVPDGVVAFAMDHDQRLLAARHFKHVQQLGIVEHEVVIGHEDLERGIAVLDQSGEFLPEHDRRRI